jgi:secreted trypsin-like serine protease
MPILWFRNALGAVLPILLVMSCSGQDSPRRAHDAARKGTPEEASGSSDANHACKAGQSSSKGLHLANAKVTSDHPAVVRIGRMAGGSSFVVCTGTFVGPRTLLTAAHCIDGSTNGGIMLLPGETFKDGSNLQGAIPAARAWAPGARGADVDFTDFPSLSQDVAVVAFDSDVAPATMAIGDESPKDGDRITMVGFGRTTLSDQPNATNEDRRKRTGTNLVFVGPANSTQLFVGGQSAAESLAADGAAALGENGDSGGPCIFNGKIVGVLSMGGTGTRGADEKIYYSSYTDLNTADGRSFQAKAKAAGFSLSSTSPSNPEAGAPSDVSAATTDAASSPSDDAEEASDTDDGAAGASGSASQASCGGAEK